MKNKVHIKNARHASCGKYNYDLRVGQCEFPIGGDKKPTLALRRERNLAFRRDNNLIEKAWKKWEREHANE